MKTKNKEQKIKPQPVEKKQSPLFDFLNSINYTKVNICDVDPLTLKSEYAPFIINRFLSYHVDCILFVNDMNIRYNLRPDIQYLYYLYSVRKGKRFSKFLKAEKESSLIQMISEFYNCSFAKAKEYSKILTEEQLEKMKEKMNKGGVGK